jgi:uncharacterized protein (DUF924 family)
LFESGCHGLTGDLGFWFASESASERDRLRDIWFQATAEFDAALAERFRVDYDRAAGGSTGRGGTHHRLALL